MLTGEMTDSAARVAHIGIAVPSIAAALAFYRDILGLAPGRSESADGATIVGLTLGDVQVELLEPHDPDSPVAKFLARRGPGDRKSTRLNSSHVAISYAVFCLKKKKLTAVTPASSTPFLQTPKATSSTLYFDSLTFNSCNGGFLHFIHMARSVDAANQTL